MAADFVLPIQAIVNFTRKIVKASNRRARKVRRGTKLFLKAIRNENPPKNGSLLTSCTFVPFVIKCHSAEHLRPFAHLFSRSGAARLRSKLRRCNFLCRAPESLQIVVFAR